MVYEFDFNGKVVCLKVWLDTQPQLGDIVVFKGKKYKIVDREYNFDENVLRVKMEEYEH